MEYVNHGLAQILASNGFANAFWIFLGIVVGAFIQYFLNFILAGQQRRNAVSVLHVEIEVNLIEFGMFMERLRFLREKISANQIQTDEIFVSMQGFDYSAMQALISTGHFHYHLGSSGSQAYFSFVRFFSNANAVNLNSMLRTNHAAGKSLDFLKWLESESLRLGAAYSALKNNR